MYLVGGLTEARKIAALADAQELPIAPHTAGGPLLFYASTHLTTASPNVWIQESCQRYYEHDWPLMLENPIVPKDGAVQVPEESGLGMRIKPEAWNHPASVHAVRATLSKTLFAILWRRNVGRAVAALLIIRLPRHSLRSRLGTRSLVLRLRVSRVKLTGSSVSSRCPIPSACAPTWSASARVPIMSARSMTKRTQSGSWPSISSGAGTPTSRNFKFFFRRRNCGCWRWSRPLRSPPS